MLTLKETLSNQNNLYHLCLNSHFQTHEFFFGNAFYGNDFILKQYAGLPETYPLKAVIPHGVYLGDSIWEAEIYSPLPVIFAYPSYHEKTYINLIQKNTINKVVIPSASPFLYLVELLKEYPKPERKGTIFFPAHSTHHVIVQADWERLAEELLNLSEEYQPVTVSIYWKDFELGRHIPFQKRGMRIVSAGHMFDKNFLLRFYHLCSTHRYSASNEIGSNLFFSIKAGCSYFYMDKFQYYYTAESEEILKRDVHPTISGRDEVLKSLFKNPKPCMTIEQLKTVDSYLGAEYLKSPEELRQQLLYAEELFKKIESSKQLFSVNGSSNKFYPKIIVDGVCFQLAQTSITKTWKYLLQEWANCEFAKYLTVIDRDGTAPKIPGIKYYNLPDCDYDNTNTERQMLQQICDEEGADVFISTYYTTPITTPWVLMVYDMIPEMMGWDLNHPIWKEKHYSIQHATAYIAFSKNTADDLLKIFPSILLENVIIAENGIDLTRFSVAFQEEINSFKTKYGISKPYFLVEASGSDYKNNLLFFQAFGQLVSSSGFEIVCTGNNSVLEPKFRTYTSGSIVHILALEDKELKVAYSGALALVHLSKNEALNLPVLEAIACGCPVIAGNNSSAIEVVGDAAIYVNIDDVNDLINALCDIQKPGVRRSLIAAGLKQAKNFSLSKMAKTVSSTLINATLLPLKLKEINLIIFPDWCQSEDAISLDLERVIQSLMTHPDCSHITLLIDTSNISIDDAELLLSSVTMNFLMQDLDVTEELEFSLIGELSAIQWNALQAHIQGRIILENDNEDAIAQRGADKIPAYNLN
ncbi:hypothetical protein NUACC21_57290 [Scytonema sp. NUACC21]